MDDSDQRMLAWMATRKMLGPVYDEVKRLETLYDSMLSVNQQLFNLVESVPTTLDALGASEGDKSVDQRKTGPGGSTRLLARPCTASNALRQGDSSTTSANLADTPLRQGGSSFFQGHSFGDLSPRLLRVPDHPRDRVRRSEGKGVLGGLGVVGMPRPPPDSLGASLPHISDSEASHSQVQEMRKTVEVNAEDYKRKLIIHRDLLHSIEVVPPQEARL
jgi:hypothetical protein